MPLNQIFGKMRDKISTPFVTENSIAFRKDIMNRARPALIPSLASSNGKKYARSMTSSEASASSMKTDSKPSSTHRFSRFPVPLEPQAVKKKTKHPSTAHVRVTKRQLTAEEKAINAKKRASQRNATLMEVGYEAKKVLQDNLLYMTYLSKATREAAVKLYDELDAQTRPTDKLKPLAPVNVQVFAAEKRPSLHDVVDRVQRFGDVAETFDGNNVVADMDSAFYNYSHYIHISEGSLCEIAEAAVAPRESFAPIAIDTELGASVSYNLKIETTSESLAIEQLASHWSPQHIKSRIVMQHFTKDFALPNLPANLLTHISFAHF